MLGLGDHIAYNGLVRRLIVEQKLNLIYVGCWGQYLQQVKFMYRDDERIIPSPLVSGGEYTSIRKKIDELKPTHIYLLGHKELPGQPFHDLAKPGVVFYQKFFDDLDDVFPYLHKRWYCYLGIDWKHRFISSYYHRDLEEENRVFNKLNPDHEEYAFIQDDPDRGFFFKPEVLKELVGDLKVIRNDKSESMFNHGIIIQNAKQVHVMESSIRPWIETLPTDESTDLYLHHYVRNTHFLVKDGKLSEHEVKKPWNLIL